MDVMSLQCTHIDCEVLIFRDSNGLGPCISKFVTSWLFPRNVCLRKEASEPKADEVPTEKEHRLKIFEGQVAPKVFVFFLLITPFGAWTFVKNHLL